MKKGKSFPGSAKAIAVAVTAAVAFSVFAEQTIGGTAPYSSDVTPLLAAVGAGDVEQVRVLLKEGARPVPRARAPVRSKSQNLQTASGHNRS
jgi:hypothetical protein